jgi:hypothetical protein
MVKATNTCITQLMPLNNYIACIIEPISLGHKPISLWLVSPRCKLLGPMSPIFLCHSSPSHYGLHHLGLVYYITKAWSLTFISLQIVSLGPCH